MTHTAAAGATPRAHLLVAEYELPQYELWVEPFAGRRRLRVTTDFALPFETASVPQAALLGKRLLVYCRASETGLWLGGPLGPAALALACEGFAQGVPVVLCEGMDVCGTFRQWTLGWMREDATFERRAGTR